MFSSRPRGDERLLTRGTVCIRLIRHFSIEVGSPDRSDVALTVIVAREKNVCPAARVVSHLPSLGPG
jgi:hypothetical protein